jgi:putative transposase
MSELRKANTDLAYFLTLTVVGWIDVFTRKELADIIIEKLKIAQRDHAVAIYAYVIMPSHIHLIAQKTNDQSLGKWIGDFKSITSKEIIKSKILNLMKAGNHGWIISLNSLQNSKNKILGIYFGRKPVIPLKYIHLKYFIKKWITFIIIPLMQILLPILLIIITAVQTLSLL